LLISLHCWTVALISFNFYTNGIWDDEISLKMPSHDWNGPKIDLIHAWNIPFSSLIDKVFPSVRDHCGLLENFDFALCSLEVVNLLNHGLPKV
jgi:hypothetical protein